MRTARFGIIHWLCLLAAILVPAATALGQPGQGAAPPGQAKKLNTYYVAPTGSDSNAGITSAKPFKTIQKAVNTVTVAGSVIYVAPGTYNEQITFATTTKNGTAKAPMRLVGDVNGTNSGVAAGDVIIHGQNVRQYGILFNSGSHWTFENFTFTDQTYANVYTNGTACANLAFDSCTINVAPTYGIYLSNLGDVSLTGNTFVRSPVSGHVTYIYQTSGTQMKITGNRLNMTGADYMSSGYRSGVFLTNRSGTMSYAYGIIAMSYSKSKVVTTIQNNLVSDAYLGIYVYAYQNASGSTINVTNNTAVGCYYAMYVYTDTKVTGTIANNITGNSYLTAYIYAPATTLSNHLSYGAGYNWCDTNSWNNCTYITVKSKTDIILNQTPTFADASGGDFSLSGTVGIDQGTATSAPTTDITGLARPIDGDGDGNALIDLGAFESLLQKARKVRIIRWEETGIGDE